MELETRIRNDSMRSKATIILLGQAVATYYKLDLVDVLLDAARYSGASSIADVDALMLKATIDYLSGRLSLPG